MADLKDVLGSILRDIAHARVVGDLFARDVSREYEQDPVLVAFPVPRAEIREATVQLRFAINRVTERAPDIADIRKRALPAGVRKLAAAVYAEIVQGDENAAAVERLVAEKGLPLRARLEAAAADVLGRAGRGVQAAIAGDPEPLTRSLRTPLQRVLLEDPGMKAALAGRGRSAAFRDRLGSALSAAVAALGRDLAAAEAAAKQHALRLDVAVGGRELAELPEAVTAQITIVAQIRNYEWVDSGGEAEPARRLQPE